MAADLEALTENLPAGTPDPVDVKALRRALGLIGHHSGALKRQLGIGG